MRSQHWRLDAACKDLSPSEADALFFGGAKGRKARDWARQRRIALCGSCPVAAQCREFGTTNNERGIWGGVKIGESRSSLHNNVA